MKTTKSSFVKQLSSKMTPSQLVKKQLAGCAFDEENQKPRIVQFLNLADYSINTQSYVSIDQPLFEAIPLVIQFTDYEPLQIKQKIFKLRNKDRFSRRVKIVQPDSRLFQVLSGTKSQTLQGQGRKVAAGMDTKFIIRFSPEAKIDYRYELTVVTQRQKFIVPIIAVGKRAMIDFPDSLDFGSCPVKYSTQKPVIVRNLGQKITKWNLELPAGFSTTNKEGVLEPGKNQQILIKFYPTEAKMYKSYAKLFYDKLQAFVQIFGAGQISNVYLSKTFIPMQESYIGLKTQQTLQIINKSNVKVSFQWRQHMAEKQQKPIKQQLRQKLNQQQQQKLMLLREASTFRASQELQFADSSDQENELDVQMRKLKKAQLAVIRQYKIIRKGIEDDLFLFDDKIFSIQPQEGQIWPNSQITVTVTFSPQSANYYQCMAYCNISCAEQRLPLKLKGEGIGPKAYLTQQQINFGDVFVNQPIKQTVQIENRGQIPCKFSLIKQQRAFAKMFEFSVQQHLLKVGESISVDIKFKSSIPGQFKQKFRWLLQGSHKHLQMTFLGHVIAPTFEFVDPLDINKIKNQLNYGKVSYDFDYKEKIVLKNTSQVAFSFFLKIQNDSKVSQSQFKISPQSDIVPQKGQKEIEISFIPKYIKKYQTVMTIDIEGVGSDMLSIPIKAQCQIPTVEISPTQKIEFGQAFLNYPNTRSIILKNVSDLKAKFVVLPQSEQSKILAKYTVSPQSDVINQRDSKQILLTLTTMKRGQITLPLHINIVGTNGNQPHVLNVCATSIGPPIKIIPEDLDFGQVEVLKDYSMKVTVINTSKIPAQFHAFTKNQISIFKPSVKHAILKPEQKLQMQVICNADDSCKFSDILHFVIKDGNDKDVVLKARGVGSTIYCAEDLEHLNFGTIYTYKTEMRQIFIQNRGRKSQKIVWQGKKINKKKMDQQKIEQQPVFVIEPESQTIPPKYGRNFKFIAYSTKTGKISQKFHLTSQAQNQRKSKILKTMIIQGQFIQPSLVYSQKKINFKYLWEKGVPFTLISKVLQITSNSTLALNFALRVSPPFYVDQQNITLQQGKSVKIKVDFDPSYKIDRVSGIVTGKINIIHLNHPHKQFIELIGQVCFPNIKLDTNMINFGAILNDTTKKVTIMMKNSSQMALDYEWTFVDQDIIAQDEKMNSSNSFGNQSVPINQIFDILPLSGRLQPNTLEEVQFVYNALGGQNFRATALCHVEGGPNYQMKLEGDSSLIGAKISEKDLDYGQQRFCQWHTKQIILQNTGKVTFEYKVSLQNIKKKGIVEVTPMQGVIPGNQKQKLYIKVCPITPQPFEETFNVQMGYFEPQTISIKGRGIAPSILSNIPRIQNLQIDTRIKEETQKYQITYKKLAKDKAKRKQLKNVQQFRNDLEKQIDRQQFCKVVDNTIQKGKVIPAINLSEAKFYEKMFVTSWCCDFGNIIIGTTQKRTFKFKNNGTLPLDLYFDTKNSKLMNYTITPENLSKMAPGDQIQVTITLATKKNMKYGKSKIVVPVDIKNGPQYSLDLLCNITIPQLIIEGSNQNIVNFGKVLCGQRKTIFLRLLNKKEIPCQWFLNLRDNNLSDKKEQVKFSLTPANGKIPSGGFQIVEVNFFPGQEKQYHNKFPLKILENSKPLTMDLKGLGTSIGLDIVPGKVKIGPVLPYDNFSYQTIQIINPTQYPTQLISLDFDKKYFEEQSLISTYQQVQNSGQKQTKDHNIYLPVRQPGSGVWPQVLRTVEVYKKKLELQKKLKDETITPQQRQKILQQIQVISSKQQTITYPKKVEPDLLHHVVIFGPPKSGKTSIAKLMKKQHNRTIVNLNQILDWNINYNTQAGVLAQQFLQQRAKQYELALQQRQKLFKKLGKKAAQAEQRLGPASQHMYQILTEDIVVQLLKQRMKHPQCAAGCIFDGLKSKSIPDALTALKIIMKAAGNQAVQLVVLDKIVPNKVLKTEELKTQYKIQKTHEQLKSIKQVSKEQELKTKSKIPLKGKQSTKDLKKGIKTSKGTVNSIPSLDVSAIQQKKQQQETITFEIADWDPETKSQFYTTAIELTKLIQNQHTIDPVIVLFKDPIFQQLKKDEKVKPSSKNAPPSAEEKPRTVDPQINKDNTLFDGNRIKTQLPIYQNSLDQKNSVVDNIPEPIYGDPLKQPIASPVYHQIISRHIIKPFDSKVTKQFSILTPQNPLKQFKVRSLTTKRQSKKQEPKEEKIEPEHQQYKLEDLTQNQTRWVVPANSSLTLIVRFFSKVTGTFDTHLTFENPFGLRKLSCFVSAKSQYPQLISIPKNIFSSIKKSRPLTLPESLIYKSFIQSENVFDFGPLLIGKNPANKLQKPIMSINSSIFKLANQGPFPTQIQLALKSTIIQNNPQYKKDIFQLSHDKVTLQNPNDLLDIRIWALPDVPQKFKDQLIIMIKDNPSPIVIPLQCTGCKPQIQITEGNPVKFTRILLKQIAKKQIRLRNNGFIPIKYRLKDTTQLPQQFTISQIQGELKPTEQTIIEVSFKAIKQQKFNYKLLLQAQDLQDGTIKSQIKQIPIQAEAFDITVQLKFADNNNENLLDFGSMRVGDYKDQTFIVKNIGLYNVKFCFVMKKKTFKDAFKIEPSQVELEPNASKEILVRCSTNRQLKLKTNNSTTDLIMEIQEGKTLETNKIVPINVFVNAVFSKYSVVPLKNINFGPIQFNQTKTRTFEIKNEGLFEFSYCIFDYNNQQFRRQLQSAAEKERQTKLQAASTLGVVGDPKKAGKKQAKQVKKDQPKKGKGGKGQIQNQLKVGQWSITPCQGSIPPQGSAIVEIIFAGSGQKLFEQKLGLDIQNRDPNDEPKGILYQLVAQSCIPGINTQNFESIFQEQVVIPSQNSGSNISDMISSNVFFVEQKIFYFGTLVPSKHPDGVVQKLKIQNSNKVPCTIKLDVRKKNPNSIQQFAFELNTKQIKIPAHDHCYINITFKPTIMASYSGLFEAIVQNGQQNPKTHKLIFDLRGEGVLPTIKVQKPKEFIDERTISLKFPKTRLGKSNVLPIMLKNDGVIPANVKWQLPANDCFRMDSNTSALAPKSYATFNVEFKPTQIGPKIWQINVQTLLNQYENSKFKIQGQGFLQQILFENLPNDLEDRCYFKNCVIGKQKSINFLLRNNGNNILRFNWKSIEDFTFIPKIGHIQPKQAVPITLVFNSSKSVNHKDLLLGCDTIQIKQNSQNFVQWNDALYVTRFVTKTEADWIHKKREQQKKKKQQQAIQAAKNAGKKGGDKKKPAPVVEQKKQQPPIPDPSQEATVQIKDPIPEPQYTNIQKTEKIINLITDAVADYAKYQISSRQVRFSPTLMYTSRLHKLSLKNVSLIQMKYTCKVVSAETGKIDPGYYLISPHNGIIQPSCDETFQIRFSPTQVQDTNERLLVINIENLDPSKQKLIIELDGQTERPICHFELQPSTYRQKKPDIEAKWNIIEFESLGTKVKNIKRFYVVNPTSMAYEFEWKKIDDDKATNSAFFRCQINKGTILSGKKTQMIFEYNPDFVGIQESYWIFEIPSQNIIQYFMMVGTVVQPNVFFDMGKINFGPLLIGGKNKETIKLKNLEDVPIPFNFDKESIRGQLQYGDSLKIQPISGTIPSQGDIPIEITFLPKYQKQFNYNLSCTIKRKSRPICINVKGIGYVLSHTVTLGASQPLQSSDRHEVNYGSIFVNQKKTKILVIENKGDFNFDYAIKKQQCGAFLLFSNQFGTVKKGQKQQISIDFFPTQQYSFSSNSFFTLSIISGPSYNFSLKGVSKKPGVEFSFYNYDFGPCFVLKNPLPVTTYLQIRNRQNTSISIQPLFEKMTYFDIKLASGQTILPLKYQTIKDKKGLNQKVQHNALKVPIVFTPRQLIKYNQTFTFNINNLHKVNIQIKGQGIPLKLQVENTQDQNIDLGIMKVGEQVHRVIPVINTSRKKIDITFDIDDQLKDLKKMFIDVSPLGDISINPRERKNIEISYYPESRMHIFKADLNYKIIQNQQKRKLLSVQSAAYGIELKLMEETIGFGTVVINSKLTKTVQFANLGDIGAKFAWDTTFCQKYFTISPKKGYLPPHQDMVFQITFHPNVVDNDIRFKIKCNIEDGDSLFLSLLGKCIDQPKQNIQTIKFDTIVRTSKIQKIQVKNPTAKAWKVKALFSSTFDNNYFSGKQFIEVPPNGATDYEIVYTPLTMTSSPENPKIKQQSHQGQLFFPIPDGSAILYKLSGKSLSPLPIQTLDFTLKAKKSGSLSIPIKNWLKNSQRFNVFIKFEVQDKFVFVNAATSFDIPSDATKQYKLSVYCLKACQSKIEVIFTNPTTNQYLSYKVNLTAQAPDLMPKTQLISLVRQATTKLITIENPLPQEIEIKKQMITVDNDNVLIQPAFFTIPAKSQFGFEVIFRPLVAKQDNNSKVTIKSPELGEFVYPLRLVGNPSTLQRSLAFKASLGSDISQTFKFIHYGRKPTTYACRVEKMGQKQPTNPDPKAKQPIVQTDFVVQAPTVQAIAADNFEGIQFGVNIKFEPSTLSESQCQLIVSSPDSGQYLCTLTGLGIAPQPKGPFKIGAKSPPIDFKNPFFEATQFIIRIDNPCFVSGTKSPVKLDSKKALSINLSYKAAPGMSNSGRLTISAGQNPPWVFYLQGQ